MYKLKTVGAVSLTLALGLSNLASAALVDIGAGWDPEWSPDGSRIAYGNQQIYSVKVDGTDRRQLTNMPSGRGAWGPTYRPGADQIFYMDNSPSGADFWWINWTNLDGSAGRNQVERVPGGDGFSPPSFSADGSQYVYQHRYYNSTNDSIEIANYNGTGVHSVISLNDVSGVAWGRGVNSDRIAFTKLAGGVRSLFSVKTDGTGEIRITDAGFGNVGDWVNWSPDGTGLLFSRQLDIFLLNLVDSSLIQITNDSYDDYAGTLSPDGSQLAYASLRNGQGEVFVVDLASQQVTEPTTFFLLAIGAAGLTRKIRVRAREKGSGAREKGSVSFSGYRR